MTNYNKSVIIPQNLLHDEYIKYVKEQVKLKILDESKNALFSDKYFIVKATITNDRMTDLNKNDLCIKGELTFEELNLENLCSILKLLK